MKFAYLAAVATAIILPATAQAAVTFNGNCISGGSTTQAACTGSSGASGNSATLKGTNDESLQVKITGWQASQSSNIVNSAFLGSYDAGFGVTGKGDIVNGVAGGGATHQIDNTGGYTDFVMLQFNRAVHLDGLNLNLFSPYTDTDSSVWNGGALTPSGAWNSTINLTNATLSPSVWSNTPGGGSGYRNVAANGFSQVWLVSASVLSTNRDDGFKLSSIIVTPQTPAVPEPATWAMMIAGFGAIGATLRRHRTAGVRQAA